MPPCRSSSSSTNLQSGGSCTADDVDLGMRRETSAVSSSRDGNADGRFCKALAELKGRDDSLAWRRGCSQNNTLHYYEHEKGEGPVHIGSCRCTPAVGEVSLHSRHGYLMQ